MENTHNKIPENVSNSIDKLLSADSFAPGFVKKFLMKSVELKASDIFVEPLDNQLRIRFRIDGILHTIDTCPPKNAQSVASCIKVISDLDIAEHRLPQDGRFRIFIDNKPIDFRVSVLPTNIGEKIVLRVLDKGNMRLDLDTLNFDKECIETLKRNLAKPYGMILACGPTGAGKTTTLYSALSHINKIDVNIMTAEDPIEYQLQGINQVAIHEDIGLTFASVLRAALRQDPDIILVGEIRDLETADVAVKAALTGHLVLSTLHTTTATGAVIRFISMGVEPFLLASSCVMTSAQALMRTLCPKCKKPLKDKDALMEVFKSEEFIPQKEPEFFEPVGCDYCSKTGYKGRVGIMEILEITKDIRELLVANADENNIRKVAKDAGMITIRERALQKVVLGLSTMDEVYRVTV
ncbi:MAG: GspE/PulE family protein [Candidatus Omnitrophica bacterium]|jgi:type IV pilus assembly protein PilB|nr:GspE/PulE family protein [Candidatus Omnitrophota bacterium]MDD5080969.1 GspE/PulE family protein [Candidatus Omnitrophota bacterium]MDD5440612.1 GspE/PulE family protein [Candidatus Omnitrophota bacterium]